MQPLLVRHIPDLFCGLELQTVELEERIPPQHLPSSFFLLLINFQSLDMFDEVNDIEWSPMCSTLFASVGKDGRLELWDLKKNNMLDPFATNGPSEGEILPSKTMIRFCNSASVVITGDVAGSVNVYRYLGK
jgi:WD40 repeat protein